MSNEALEAKLVQKTVSILRMARHVIERMNADKEGERFSEEPSLSDLVLVAQIINQTSTMDRLGDVGVPGPDHVRLGSAPPPPPGEQGVAVAIGMPMLPDLAVLWTPDGWYVQPHPDFKVEPICCQSQEDLLTTLQQLAVVCGQHRIPPPIQSELPPPGPEQE